MSRRAWLFAACLAGALSVAGAGCNKDSSKQADTVATDAVELTRDHECAACGMFVMDQSAPRAQAVHRDGTRSLFCSIGDLLAYLKEPSPHGAVLAVYVETQDPAVDPKEVRIEPRPWLRAADASFVVGIPKPMVMGQAVMAYTSEAEAAAIARDHGGEVRTWSGLQTASRP